MKNLPTQRTVDRFPARFGGMQPPHLVYCGHRSGENACRCRPDGTEVQAPDNAGFLKMEERVQMILADKIITLRKKAGWSQEELAEKLGVTRQSVSKWEGAQSIPDMEKILMLSDIFGVSTDVLLKDALDLSDTAQEAADTAMPERRRVTLEEAHDYLEKRKLASSRMALATFLCVLSPVPLIFLSGLTDGGLFPVSENGAVGVGMCLMLFLLLGAVVLFQRCAAAVREYAFLDKDAFETAYGVAGMVKERKNAFRPCYDRYNLTGLVFCILAVLPLFAASVMGGADMLYITSVCLLLILAACGVYAFVRGGVYEGAMDRLLEEGDFTRENKSISAVTGTVSGAYWLVTTAVFFLVANLPTDAPLLPYKNCWILWAVAGVLYAALLTILKQFCGKR